MKPRQKRVFQSKMWEAARLYCRDANKCYKAKAYFSALITRACELEALLRIFGFVQSRRPKDRCHSFEGLINRAFAKHWILHDGLRYWKATERVPLKTCLHELREARDGVHAHLFQKDLFTRRTAANVSYLVHSMYNLIEIKNARSFMKNLHERGEISTREYHAWKKKQLRLS
jgi:hypothetical protein